MIGFSVNLYDEISMIKEYIRTMKNAGFNSVFTTIFVPEEDKSRYLENLKAVGEECKKNHMELMLGISEESIEEVGLDMSVDSLKEMGITGIRVTHTTDPKLIADLSEHMKVAISASHTTSEDLKRLNDLGAEFNNLEAWFYYYDREEIGLSEEYMKNRIRFWKNMDIKTCAFAPGDDHHIGVFVGHLTLEKHRRKHPLYSCINLLEELGVDSVIIGDSPLHYKTIHQFSNYMEKKLLVFYVDVLDYEYFPLVKGLHKNRIDEAEYVIRAEDMVFKSDVHVVNRYLVSRPRGSLTLDNYKYGRYMGEFHITKVDMELSRRVNVVAHVREEDIDLIDVCSGGTLFEIVDNAEENNKI